MDSSSLFRPWRKFRRLSWRERGWLLQAWCALPAIQWRLHRLGFKQTRALLEVPIAQNRTLNDDDAAKLAGLARIAGRRHFMTFKCLPQSLWVWNRLRRLGFACELQLGVTRMDSPGFEAHAWVELNGRSLDGGRQSEPDQLCSPFRAVSSSEIQ